MRSFSLLMLVFQLISSGLSGITIESFYNSKMKQTMDFNRSTLSQVPTWLLRDQNGAILDAYCLPDIVIQNIDKYIGDEITYSDLLNYLSTLLNKEVRFLELGVSVGKNLFQVCNFLRNATIVGVDFLEINKPLENLLTNKEVIDSWESYEPIQPKYELHGLLKKYEIKDYSILEYYNSEINQRTISSITKYSYANNRIYFFNGRILDENVWKKMSERGFKFNLCFSDAYHRIEAVLYEYEMMSKYNLIDDEFVLMWDDLNVVKYAFDKIWNELNEKYPKQLIKFEFPIRGWIGNHGNDWHYIGVILKTKSRFDEIK